MCKNANPEGLEKDDLISMLIVTLAQSKKVHIEGLSAIKAAVLKKAERTRNPKIEIFGNQTFFDLPCLPIKSNPLTISTSMYKELPRFDTIDGKPLKSYNQMYSFLSELTLLVIEYQLD